MKILTIYHSMDWKVKQELLSWILQVRNFMDRIRLFYFVVVCKSEVRPQSRKVERRRRRGRGGGGIQSRSRTCANSHLFSSRNQFFPSQGKFKILSGEFHTDDVAKEGSALLLWLVVFARENTSMDTNWRHYTELCRALSSVWKFSGWTREELRAWKQRSFPRATVSILHDHQMFKKKNLKQQRAANDNVVGSTRDQPLPPKKKWNHKQYSKADSAWRSRLLETSTHLNNFVFRVIIRTLCLLAPRNTWFGAQVYGLSCSSLRRLSS